MRVVTRTRIGENTFLYSSCNLMSFIWLGLGFAGLILACKYHIFSKIAHFVVAVISIITIFITLLVFANCKCKKEVLGGLLIAGSFGGLVGLLLNFL